MFSLLSECSAPSPAPPTITPAYLAASLVLGAGLATPHSSPPLCVLVRLLLTAAHLAYCAWSYSDLCSVPLFCWHSVLGLVSLAKFSEAVWRCWPPSLHSSVRSLYAEMFQPLGVTREDFVTLLRDSTVEEIPDEGHVWAAEGSVISQGLSVLLGGRLVVRAGGAVLHKVDTGHFLQSIEWAARGHQPDQPHTFQVALEVEAAPVTILHLNTHILDTVLDTRPDLRLVIECLVAKDVSMKLYMMNKMIGDTDLALAASRDKATQRRGRGKMSSSMDAINTGWKGLMRSYFWSELGSGAGALGGSGSGFNRCLDMPAAAAEQGAVMWPHNEAGVAGPR